MTSLESLRDKFATAGQEQVFKYADDGKLSEAQKAQLAAQLEKLDLDRISKVFWIRPVISPHP